MNTLKQKPLIILSTMLSSSLLYAAPNEESGNGLLYFALFCIVATIGIAFAAYKKINAMKLKYQQMQENSHELEEKQNLLLANMSESIYKMVKQTVGSTSALVDKIDKNELNQELSHVIQTENQLLDIANDLIEFLQLKSKKVQISHKRYKLDNLLNDLTGFVSKSFQTKPIQLTYHVDKDIPQELIGDTLKISKVLYNLLEYSIRNGATELLLKTSKTRGFQSDSELTFFVQTNLHIDIENDTCLFKTQYNETTNTYDSLGLFVAKELTALMQGELIARNDKEGRVEFLFSMVFQKPDNIQNKKVNPKLLNKKVAIIDNNPRYTLALATMLDIYEHKVTQIRPEDFFQKPQKLEQYDIIALDEKLFSASIVKKLEKVHQENGVKIIALSNFFHPSDAQYYTKVADFKLLKPTTRGTILRLLEKIYLSKDELEALQSERKVTTNLKVHKSEFANTPDVSIDTFALFKGAKVLIVEDDIINQKVVKGVLKHSQMDIDLANNGEECLEILEKNPDYDIILMDINMPVMDGYTATRKIRQDSTYDTIPIIALTALTSADEMHKMFDAGMNGHLAKPLHKAKLFTALDMFIEQTNEQVEIPPHERKPIHVDGLDIQQGLSRASGNEEFYKEVLEEFLTTYRNSAQLFEKLIQDFRYEQVRMLCLDIKGLSALIGANELHSLMVDIHQQLIFKKFDLLDAYIPKFYNEIEKLTKSINSYIED